MKLFFRQFGSGPPLIILHGLYGSSDNWVSIAKGVRDRFSIILPDQRNHGASPHSEIHDYTSMKNDLHELVTDLKIDRFFLAGHSMGGKTAVRYALAWPEKLAGLLVADISPFTEKSKLAGERNFHLRLLQCIMSVNFEVFSRRSQIEESIMNCTGSEKITGLILKNLKREHDNSFAWKLNAESLFSNLDRIMEPVKPEPGDQKEISGFPVLFLKGEMSEYLQEDDLKAIKSVFPAAELITIPGSGHWIHADNPEAVRNCLTRFLEY
jgi:pimeloyl-ACP methyl ester carboxylesterase